MQKYTTRDLQIGKALLRLSFSQPQINSSKSEFDDWTVSKTPQTKLKAQPPSSVSGSQQRNQHWVRRRQQIKDKIKEHFRESPIGWRGLSRGFSQIQVRKEAANQTRDVQVVGRKSCMGSRETHEPERGVLKNSQSEGVPFELFRFVQRKSIEIRSRRVFKSSATHRRQSSSRGQMQQALKNQDQAPLVNPEKLQPWGSTFDGQPDDLIDIRKRLFK